MAIEHKHPNKPPYGYIRDPITEHLEIEPIEAEVVKNKANREVTTAPTLDGIKQNFLISLQEFFPQIAFITINNKLRIPNIKVTTRRVVTEAINPPKNTAAIPTAPIKAESKVITQQQKSFSLLKHIAHPSFILYIIHTPIFLWKLFKKINFNIYILKLFMIL